ncbi:MAG: hypothetical protein QMB27_11595, partial [Rhodospirillales bacterium]
FSYFKRWPFYYFLHGLQLGWRPSPPTPWLGVHHLLFGINLIPITLSRPSVLRFTARLRTAFFFLLSCIVGLLLPLRNKIVIK